MDECAAEFFNNWLDQNVHGPPYPFSKVSAAASELVVKCITDAAREGISEEALEIAAGDLFCCMVASLEAFAAGAFNKKKEGNA
jgi:hypothetical protein